MKVLLIGGTGFIGRSVVERLLADGHALVGLARSDAAAAALAAKGVEARHVEGGLNGDPAELVAAAKGCDAAIDMAVHNFRDAIPGIQSIRAGLGKDGILISTTGTNFYGDVSSSEDDPVSEDREFGWKPRAPELWPDELRSMMERLAIWWPKFEASVLDASEGAAARTCILRPGLVYGRGTGGLGGGVLARLKYALEHAHVLHVSDGRSGRGNCVHVDDLADLYAIALRSLALGALPAGSVLNACSGTFSKRDLVGAVAATCGNLPVHELPVAEAAKVMGAYAAEEATMNCVPDVSRARELGWTPTRPSLIEDVTNGSYVGVVAQLRSSILGQAKL